jgi:hypothetical protein
MVTNLILPLNVRSERENVVSKQYLHEMDNIYRRRLTHKQQQQGNSFLLSYVLLLCCAFSSNFVHVTSC